MSNNTVSTLGLRSVLVSLASIKAKPSDILEKAKINREIIDDPDGRISIEDVNNFWNETVNNLGDTSIPLNMAKFIPFGTYQITDYLLSCANNINEGLQRYFKYYSIVNEDISLIGKEDNDMYKIIITPNKSSTLNTYALDYELGLLANRLMISSNHKIEFSTVNISHNTNNEDSYYSSLFKSEVNLNAKETSLNFKSKYLKLPCSENNSNLLDLIEKNAIAHIKTIETAKEKEDVFLVEFYSLINNNLKDGDFTIEGISQSLNMSVRTLQRKLKEYDLSYKDALLETRKKLSLKLLQDPNLSVAEIAYLTGFSEASAFHRAFKKWTGKTPLKYRKED